MFRDICRVFALALVAGVIWGNAQITSSSAMAADDEDALTKAYVMKAIERYKRDGREATLAYYSSRESIEGERLMLIIDPQQSIILASGLSTRVGAPAITRRLSRNSPKVYPRASVRPRPPSVQSLRKASGWIIKVFIPEPDS